MAFKEPRKASPVLVGASMTSAGWWFRRSRFPVLPANSLWAGCWEAGRTAGRPGEAGAAGAEETTGVEETAGWEETAGVEGGEAGESAGTVGGAETAAGGVEGN